MLYTTSGGPRVRVRITLVDGATRDIEICGGIDGSPECRDGPYVILSSRSHGGYRDRPGGASLPSLDPAAVASARAFSLDEREIPIDGPGMHEVVLGEAVLPNGVLTEDHVTIGPDWPEGFVVGDGGIGLVLRSKLPDGRPFQNLYEHGWRDGLEPVDVVFFVDVALAPRDAVLTIRDVEVR